MSARSKIITLASAGSSPDGITLDANGSGGSLQIKGGAVGASLLGTITDGTTLDQAASGSKLEIKAGGVGAAQMGQGWVVLENKANITAAASLDFVTGFNTRYKAYKLLGTFQGEGGGSNLALQVNGDATAGNYGDKYYSALTPTGVGGASPTILLVVSRASQQNFIEVDIIDGPGLTKPFMFRTFSIADGSAGDYDIGGSTYKGTTGAITELKLTVGGGTIGHYNVTLMGLIA